MRRLIMLVISFACATWALAETAVPLPNSSFEQGTEQDLQGWAVTACEGATFKLSFTSQPSHSGARALVIEKTNCLGYLLLHTAKPVTIQPKVDYESSLQLRVVQRQFGGRVYFVNEEFDAAGKITGVRYSPNHLWTPGYLPEGQWKRLWARWTSSDRAASVNLRFAIIGNPSTLVIDDLTLVSDPTPYNHPAKIQSSEKPYDEALAEEVIRKRQAQPASVKMLRGQPQFVIGAKAYAPLIHNGSFWNPDLSKFGGFGRVGIHLHTLAVQLGPQDAQNLIWKYPAQPDFSYLDRLLHKIASADPEAQVIVLVRCDLPRGWGLDHPEHVFTNEDGSRVVSDGHPSHAGTPEKPTEYWPASYGSPLYQETVIGVLRQLGEWVRDHESGKLVVGWMIAGGNDGQFFTNSLLPRQFDHSPGEIEGFRRWLREEYGTEAKLQAAWGDPAVTFASATKANTVAWKSAQLFHALQGPGRRVVDTARFESVISARCVRLFARALKQSVGRPTFAMTYYPDAVHDGGSNKYAVSELLTGDDIDAATAVQEYGQWRSPGGTGCTNASWGAYRVRNKLHVAEIDYRTYLSGMSGFWDPEQLGATLTAEGFRSQVRRDIAASCARGMGAWFYDMGGVWYDDPPLWEVIAEARRMMEWSHRPEAPAPAAQMAVFVDEMAGNVIDAEQFGLLHVATNEARLALNLSGVPYDLYLLEDLVNPKLPDYKVYLLLDSFTITKQQMAAVQAKARRAGRTLIVCGMPGGASLDYPSAEKAFTELTGWRSEMLPENTAMRSQRAPVETDPLLAGVPDCLSYTGGQPARWPLPVLKPGLKTLGTLLAGGKPSHVIERSPRGTVLYIAPPGGFTPELLRNVAREAGVKTLGTPGQATYVGCGIAAVHHITPGEASLQFSQPVDLVDPLTGQVTARKITRWPAEAGLLETALGYYR